MSFTLAKPITSPQKGVHKNLEKTVLRHFNSQNQKPIAEHNRQMFTEAYQWWQGRKEPKVILDSGCGTGESSRYLAGLYPDHCVIGLDQSAKRLGHNDNIELPDNCLLLRCECTDFWRLAEQTQWSFDHHTLFYPNPYPKPQHLQRRWHGGAAFPSLLAISQKIELRTNWKIYAKEFYAALLIVNQHVERAVLHEYRPEQIVTAFERKYWQSGHSLWKVILPIPISFLKPAAANNTNKTNKG
ncbi:hypothetical protein AB835_13665 [Candidatus Endobugula sertula]|uniref:tRNA (guanine(46)-N(7))-methyltransferase n=1 Tax=Candidatus Endobugula sertula TaxID=62101 RepID=A0A1D2QLT4_9GAMM|nr:hypothetical protein AB835_13665 [Candidatus Endobugula sertula]